MKRALRVVVIALTLTLASSACGSDSPGVSAGAARSLHAEIAALRTTAAQRDRAATAAQADRLDRLITRLHTTDAIDAAAARRLRRALATVRARITLIPLPTTTTTTTTVPDDEPGKGRGRGSGKGHVKDQDGDD